MEGFETTKHESFGIIEINRTTGSRDHLFGSSIEHQHTINLRILEGEIQRGLSRDWFHGGKIIVEVAMSQTQFAEAITSIGSSGTPCTIMYRIDKGVMGKSPFESKVRQFNDEFQKDMIEIASKCDALIKEAEDRKLPKSIQHQLKMLKQDLACNVPFVNKQFTEQMEHTVKEAKGEVDAFITSKIHSLGLEAFRNQLPSLDENKLLEKGT